MSKTPRPAKKSATPAKVKTAKFKAALDRPDLTEELVEGIVVGATPKPHEPSGQDEPLKDFDILDDVQARVHAGKIQGALGQIGYQIMRADIDTGPTVSVGDCVISVLDHAH